MSWAWPSPRTKSGWSPVAWTGRCDCGTPRPARSCAASRVTQRGCRAVAFSPDGRRVLSGSWDRTLRLWDVKTGKEMRCFKGHTDEIRTVAFTPDGRRAPVGRLRQDAAPVGRGDGRGAALPQGTRTLDRYGRHLPRRPAGGVRQPRQHDATVGLTEIAAAERRDRKGTATRFCLRAPKTARVKRG